MIARLAALVGLSIVLQPTILQRCYADDAIVTYKSLSPDVALEAAQAALKRCRTDRFQVAVVVIDRFGEAQVLLRDRFAGLPASRTATDKAWTAWASGPIPPNSPNPSKVGNSTPSLLLCRV